jgi:hypothetical protein
VTGTDVVNFEQQWAEYAQDAAKHEPVAGGTWLTARGGELKIGDEVLPGAQAAVIVIDSYRENTYYGERFDPDNPTPPICYALGRDDEAMFPSLAMQQDPTWFKPQHWENGQVAGCDGCPMNQWGSAAQGRGKACQNRRRLVLLPAGAYVPRQGSRDFDLHLFTDNDHYARAETAMFKVPVTSVKSWANYVNTIATSVQRPPFGVVTRLAVVPHAKHQFEVTFDLLDVIPDNLAPTIMRRWKTARETPMPTYLPPDRDGERSKFRGR